ncbi:MAG: LegC family aminotransferase [Bacteroidaceae bacterium]|nr:LegC family aminotransferase [Bacteroidaceae bacterium]
MKYSRIINFIKDLYGNQEFTPLAVPKFLGREKEYLNECIDTTFVSSVGKFVDKFEDEVAKYTGAKRAVVCVSGTNALHMSLMLAGVKRDDEVLTQALTFIATCNALSYIGAHPVFIDVDKSTMGLSPDALKEWLTGNAEIRKNRKTDVPESYDFAYEDNDGLACYNKHTGRRVKACVPMHTFGCPVRIDEIAAICKEWHIELVEDAAESIGSRFKGQHTGTFGKVGALSFNGNKTITTGGGGMLLFNDEKMGDYCKHITTQAKIPHRWEFRHDHIGYNYRMPNINAALGCAQLENLDRYVADKRATAAAYAEFFKGMDDIQFFVEPENCFSNYWLNVVILKDKEAQLEFLQETNDNGVMTRPIWELMNRLPMFEKCGNDGLKNTVWFADRVVNIPSSVRLEK